jgi:hypothetical protein
MVIHRRTANYCQRTATLRWGFGSTGGVCPYVPFRGTRDNPGAIPLLTCRRLFGTANGHGGSRGPADV